MSGGVTFKKVPIEGPGDMATVDEVKDNKDKVMDIMDEWTIAVLDGGKVDGRGHGGKVYHGNYKGQCGEKIVIFGRVPKDLKLKKVPCDDDSNRMATVAEARANHEKVLSLLDEWTIALLDGGKVDGPGHGGKVQEGDFKSQCGEKIIVEGSGIKEIETKEDALDIAKKTKDALEEVDALDIAKKTKDALEEVDLGKQVEELATESGVSQVAAVVKKSEEEEEEEESGGCEDDCCMTFLPCLLNCLKSEQLISCLSCIACITACLSCARSAE